LETGARAQGMSYDEFVLAQFTEASVALHFEKGYQAIYKSQMDLLRAMRDQGKAFSRMEVQVFYDAAKNAYPAMYTNYALDNWLAFLKSMALIEEGQHGLKLTLEGQLFLEYIITYRKYNDAGRVG